uniref:(northern house mosquito) hypothetical protein n=1 Tax=Culex pipiens TaxID=7175 RepID=A0A8D8B602_CULPI
MDESQPVKLLSDRAEPAGGTGRRAGQPCARWRDQVNVDIRKICNLGNWRVAAHDRERWKRLLLQHAYLVRYADWYVSQINHVLSDCWHFWDTIDHDGNTTTGLAIATLRLFGF